MTALKIFIFTILITAFYSYVGQMVPQKETYPPEDVEFGENMSMEEMVAVGEEIVAGKGTCLGCHTIGQHGSTLRFPDLAGIGSRAETVRAGYTDVEYLAESLYEPNAHIVEGFAAGMPAIHRPPIGLNDREILAVIAYLQSLGGSPSVTLETTTEYTGSNPVASSETAVPATPSAAPTGEPLDGPALYAKYLCATCHSADSPTQLIGPSLYDVGSRLTSAELYESIMDPDAVVAEGFPPGIMSATLQGYYSSMTTEEVNTLVDYLATLNGG